jgi:hypothetical protein
MTKIIITIIRNTNLAMIPFESKKLVLLVFNCEESEKELAALLTDSEIDVPVLAMASPAFSNVFPNSGGEDSIILNIYYIYRIYISFYIIFIIQGIKVQLS